MDTEFDKEGGHTEKAQTGGTKQLKQDFVRLGQPCDIYMAPPSRIYTRDYRKVQPDPGDRDTVSPYVGNPLIW